MMAPRIRLLAIDKGSGKPRPNVPLGITAEIPAEDCDGTPIVRPITLVVLQSDHVGYASIELKENVQLSSASHIWVYPLADEESRVDAKPTIDLGLDRSVVNIPIPSWIESDPFRRFPAIPAPDATDRDISPRSFANQPELTLGKGGCEEFLLNAVAERTFRFSQIVFQPDQAIASLESVDSSHNEFSTPIQYRMGALLEYEMQWLPLGHALGEIVYSLPLAPCESVNLAVIEWAREDSAARTESLELREELIHSQRRDRVIEEAVSATLREWQRGGSILGGGSIAGALGGGLFGAFALGGGYSTSSGDRDVNAETIQTIADSVSQATTAVRSMFSTVIVQAAQSERDIVETRTVTNHNHCHALTILYYELLRQYRVVTGLAKGTDVIMIKKAHPNFTPQTALCSRPYLEPVLLEPRLMDCFDALVRVHYEAPPETTTEATETQVVEQFIIKIATGSEGTDGDVWFKVMLSDGTIRRLGGDLDTSGRDDFESGQTNTFRRSGEGILVDDIEQIGVEYEGGGWDFKGLEVIYKAEGRSGLQTLYVNDSINHHFGDDADWWDVVKHEEPDEGPDPADLQRKLDEACARHLIDHLNCHKSYYWRVIWMSQDPGVYATAFDRYPYPPGSSSGRLLDHIELRPVAVIGEYIAFPLNTSEFASKLSRQGSSEPVERFVSLPTRGVFAEAKLSSCCACEERDITKYWDWSESPCPDKAPGISGISPGSRARDIDTTPSDLPAPIVNIVNPPAAPDPTGLANALNLLATSNIFRDMSGREEVSALLQKLADVAGNLAKAGLSSDDDETGGSGRVLGSRGGTSSGSGSPGTSRSSPVSAGLSAREAHDRIQVARDAVRQGNLTETQGNEAIEGFVHSMAPVTLGSEEESELDVVSTVAKQLTPDCRVFKPADITAIVLDATEYPSPIPISHSDGGIVHAFRNWGADPDDPHRPAEAGNGVWHYDFGPAEGRSPANCRTPGSVNAIVLHETGSDNTPASGPPGLVNRRLGAHFLILRDGRAVQFNDVVDEIPHGGNWNSASVGIEFANSPWVGGGERIDLEWEGADYRVPPIEAMETCAAIVRWLVEYPDLGIPPVFRNLQLIPGTGELAWHIHWHPTATGPSLHTPEPGIISHNVYVRDKSDGWFQALYCWCRLQHFDGAGLSDSDAYLEARRIAQSAYRNVAGNIFIPLVMP